MSDIPEIPFRVELYTFVVVSFDWVRMIDYNPMFKIVPPREILEAILEIPASLADKREDVVLETMFNEYPALRYIDIADVMAGIGYIVKLTDMSLVLSKLNKTNYVFYSWIDTVSAVLIRGKEKYDWM